MKRRIVVVGAGYAGILAAKKLAKNIKKQKLSEQVDVTIIDRNPFHTMLTELHEVAGQRVEEDSIRISLRRVFAGRAVDVVTDTVKSVDYDKKSVICEQNAYSYDYLVLASGSQPIFFGVEGAQEHTHTLWSYDDAVKLREHIVNMFRLAEREPDPAKKKALLTFVVVGCGFTGVEMAGELAELIPSLCRRFEIDRDLVTLIDMDMLDRVCMVLPEKLSGKVQRRLEKMRVNVMLKTGTVRVGADFIEYKQNEQVTRLSANTVIWTAGVESSELAKASNEKLGTAPRGRVQTDEYLRSINDKSVYIGGDNIYFIPQGEKNSVPQMVENAEACADTIAHNLLCDLTGKGEKESYRPKFHGVMVCVGGRYGVAHIGLPGKFFGLPSFLAMFCKHFVNILYFIKVLGWNKIFSYIRHEFFTVRDCRSFVGGHLSNRSPSFFLVPLRVYIGAYWVYEGIMKIVEGWFEKPSLGGFYSGANAFYEGIINPGSDAASAASGATEAVSSASGAVTDAAASAGDVILNQEFLWIFKIIYVHASDYAAKLQIYVMDWFMDTLVLPSDTMQMIFQISIVLAEILIGLALMGGLFTTPAAVVSIVLQFLFLTSTGLYMATWWMLFASVALLFGAGRVFSLDYYVQPWLKKHWGKVKFARKWYLYHD
ncbi:NADH dehydrogenase [Clostridia bacterium]|nr:NADH dehydrogenase [Clostridia bacterium]